MNLAFYFANAGHLNFSTMLPFLIFHLLQNIFDATTHDNHSLLSFSEIISLPIFENVSKVENLAK